VHQLGVSITPLHPESALMAAGARFESRRHPIADFFANHYVADGDLITGQNQNSGPMVARLMMQRVLEKKASEGKRTSSSAAAPVAVTRSTN
jgi:putative intracellular protease/amidase